MDLYSCLLSCFLWKDSSGDNRLVLKYLLSVHSTFQQEPWSTMSYSAAVTFVLIHTLLNLLV